MNSCSRRSEKGRELKIRNQELKLAIYKLRMFEDARTVVAFEIMSVAPFILYKFHP